VKQQVISADSHVVEPSDLWTSRLPLGLRDRGPQLVTSGRLGWSVDGGAPEPIDDLISQNSDSLGGDGLRREDLLRGCSNAADRVREQTHDSVDGEVLYPHPTAWTAINKSSDSELKLACYRAYNDWIAEFAGHAPDRLHGLAKIPTTGIDDAVTELKRIAGDLRLRGAILDAWPAGSAQPSPSDEEPFWAAAEELGIPISIHKALTPWLTPERPPVGPGLPPGASAVPQALAMSGVWDRHPGLRVVIAHGNAGWLAQALTSTDDFYLRMSGSRQVSLANPDLLPSDYVRQHCWFTFGEDRTAIHTRQYIGAFHLMWASYAPTLDSQWPNDRAMAETLTAELPSAEKDALLGENCLRLYGIGGADFTNDEVVAYKKLVLI
jgi:predicted TIM-barrel fold metal-dependent hydrolase